MARMRIRKALLRMLSLFTFVFTSGAQKRGETALDYRVFVVTTAPTKAR